jgi:hypothetical protein
MTAEELHKRIYEKGVLRDWAKYLREKLLDRIDQYHIGKTGDLARSIRTSVSPDRVFLQFSYYGKFVDMGVGKGSRIGDVKENSSVLSKAIGIRQSRKPKKWYSRTMAGQIKKLSEIIASEYGRETAEFVKQNFQLPIIIEL